LDGLLAFPASDNGNPRISLQVRIFPRSRNSDADKGGLRLPVRADTGDHSIFPRDDKLVHELMQLFPVHSAA
jgi:hypothetical protein